MPAIFEHCLTVTAEQIDLQGHVNNIQYIRWMQDAAVAHSAAQGWPTSRYLASGAWFVVRTHFVEYISPAFENDEIMVKTWVSDFRRSTTTREFLMIRRVDQRMLAKARTEWVYVDLEKRTPIRIPAPVREAFELVGSPTGPTENTEGK